MKNIMMTTVAMALAFSVPPFAAAQIKTATDSNVAGASDKSIAKVNTDNSTKTIDVTKKNIDVDVDIIKATDSHDQKSVNITKKSVDLELTKNVDSNNQKTKTTTHTNSGDATASGAFGAAANNSSHATTSLTNAFNKTTLVTATKLDGHVSGNSIHDIGNTGGYAVNGGSTGYGGDGGNAKAGAYSGKAVSNGGDGANAKGGSGGDGGKGSIDQENKNGYARNSEKAHGKAFQAAKSEAEARAKGADGGEGGKGGNGGSGGAGGTGGASNSGEASVKRTHGGDGGNGGAIRVRGGEAGTFDASNTMRGSFNHAGGIMAPIQNTGAASLQQVGVTVMATINSSRPAMAP